KFLLILAPYAPYLTEELWSLLGHSESIHIATWPAFDPSLLVADTLEIPVQVNGKVRGTIVLAQQDIDNETEVQKIAKEAPSVMKHLTGNIVKVVYVRGKILNFICK
ncbi:class I tRNA ligase family protein, partial [Candidatus Woesebacteria bacterium]|nr:class I tRNA ligase family protein [Candidatus Woesebacteria bacterium]